MHWNDEAVRNWVPSLIFERGQHGSLDESSGDGRWIWGRSSTAKKKYETSVELPTGAAVCNCSSASPCKHAVTLMLTYIKNPDRFALAPVSTQSNDSVEKLAQRCAKEHGDKNDNAALRSALELWQVLVANQFYELAQLIAPVVEALGLLDAEDLLDTDWTAIAKTHDPGHLSTLLDTLNIKDNHVAISQIKVLADWPNDPRLSRYLCRLLETMRVLRSQTATEFWVRVFHLLARIPDTRSLALLQTLAGTHKQLVGVYGRYDIEERIGTVVAELSKRFSDAKVPTETTVRECEKLVDSCVASSCGSDSTVSGEALLAQVYTDPNCNEARYVWSDYLSEIDDPRGEFIALQLQRAAGAQSKPGAKREKELFKKHRDEWLGSLLPLILKGDAVFERGFLDSCTANTDGRYSASQEADDPMWATVRVVHGAYASFCLDPRLVSLREIEISDTGLEEMLERGESRPFTRLMLTGPIDEAIVNLLKCTTLLPKLTNLELVGNPGSCTEIESLQELAPLLESKIFRQLNTLMLRGNRRLAGEIIECVAGQEHIKNFRYWSLGHFDLSSASRRFDSLHIKMPARNLRYLLPALQSMDPSRYNCFSLVCGGKSDPDDLQAVQNELNRFRDIRKLKLPKGW